MVYVLAQETNIKKIKKVIRINKNSESVCEISVPELLELSHIETLVVDWGCHKILRSLYRKISVDNLVFVVGNYYIDSSDAGKKFFLTTSKQH